MSSAAFWRRASAAVPATNERAHIERVLHRYVDTWAEGDIEGRLALFADDIVIEDPATVRRASGLSELRTFFAAGIPSSWDLAFHFERVAVVGDEAILTYRTTLRVADHEPAELLINSHVVFGAGGKITSFRVFFDAEAITDPASGART